MTNTYLQNVIDETGRNVNSETDEILAKPESVEIGTTAMEVFIGISTLDIPKDISDKLTQPVKAEEIEIKPTGEIYLSHVRYRRMLNDAFGMGNWSLRPLGGFVKIGNVVCREYALYIKGKYAASAIGEQAYIESNAMMTWSDACEATKSNVIMRCCKDLGIGLEMWDKKFVEKFKAEFCVQVWIKNKLKPQWRLKGTKPSFDEIGIVDHTKKQEPTPTTHAEAIAYNPQVFTAQEHNEAIGLVTGIRKETKTNRTTKAEFVIYHIKLDNNIEYTASGKDAESFMAMAKTAAGNGLQVQIETKGDKYNTITSIDTVEPDFSEPRDGGSPNVPRGDIPCGHF